MSNSFSFVFETTQNSQKNSSSYTVCTIIKSQMKKYFVIRCCVFGDTHSSYLIGKYASKKAKGRDAMTLMIQAQRRVAAGGGGSCNRSCYFSDRNWSFELNNRFWTLRIRGSRKTLSWIPTIILTMATIMAIL